KQQTETALNNTTPTMSVSQSTSQGQIEYAVQIGVYKTASVPNSLSSLVPHAETMKNGLYRFITPRVTAYEAADASKKNAMDKGVKDAFIVAYKNGNRVALKSVHSFSSPVKEMASGKMKNVPVNNKKAINYSPASTITTGKTNTGIVYKIQMGAYRKAISDHSMNELKRV